MGSLYETGNGNTTVNRDDVSKYTNVPPGTGVTMFGTGTSGSQLLTEDGKGLITEDTKNIVQE